MLQQRHNEWHVHYQAPNIDSQSYLQSARKVERKNFAQKLKKLEPFDCEVSEKQDAELVTQINKKGSKDIIKEGDEVLGEDNLLRDAWRQRDWSTREISVKQVSTYRQL